MAGQNCRETASFSSFSQSPHISFLLLALAMAVSTHVQCRSRLYATAAAYAPALLSLMAKK